MPLRAWHVALNNFWWPDDTSRDPNPCTIVGYIGKHTFPNGVSKHTYVIEHEGNDYAIRHSALRMCLSAATRRRISKQGAPRVVKSK